MRSRAPPACRAARSSGSSSATSTACPSATTCRCGCAARGSFCCRPRCRSSTSPRRAAFSHHRISRAAIARSSAARPAPSVRAVRARGRPAPPGVNSPRPELRANAAVRCAPPRRLPAPTARITQRLEGDFMLRLLGALGASLLCALVLGQEPAGSAAPVKAVLVTGASSGIGRKITERLASQGYFVYATARKEEDLKALGAIRNVQALRLDVTQPADIAAAVESISKAGRGLYGLVNNAGVATLGTIAEMSFEEFDVCM